MTPRVHRFTTTVNLPLTQAVDIVMLLCGQVAINDWRLLFFITVREWGNGTINVIKGQRDNPVGNANATPTGYYVRKYIPEAILGSVHTGTSRRLWTFIRYAEIMLNYAEALNEVQGPSTEVYNMLDQIRRRSGITGSVANRSDLTSSKEAMRNFIHKERTVELAFEEHRAWDVRRWNM